MPEEDWRGLHEEALERLLVERWIDRGSLLCDVVLAASIITYLGVRGIGELADQLTVGPVAAPALAAAVVMGQHDLKVHSELRRRRRGNPEPPAR